MDVQAHGQLDSTVPPLEGSTVLSNQFRLMPFSVYVAKPPPDGGYEPHIYKVGKTTEEDVQSRIAALNDSGSNYLTANGENWELVDQFSLANQDQMDAFESAVAEEIGTGLDPMGTGATELFESAALEVDVHDAALSAIKTLVEIGLLEVGAIAKLAAAHGAEAAATATAHLQSSTDGLTEDAVDLIAELVWELLPLALPALGIALALWRGKRIYSWVKGQWEHRLEYWRTAAPPRPPEPKDVTEADQAFKRARAATDNRRQPG